MALKVKAKEQFQNIGKYAGQYRYVMMPEQHVVAQELLNVLHRGCVLPPVLFPFLRFFFLFHLFYKICVFSCETKLQKIKGMSKPSHHYLAARGYSVN